MVTGFHALPGSVVHAGVGRPTCGHGTLTYIPNMSYKEDDDDDAILAPYEHLIDSITNSYLSRSEFTANTDKSEKAYFDVKTFPNPFSKSCTIALTLTSDASITMNVTNAYGQTVGNLCTDVKLEAGEQEFIFPRGDLSSGTYFLNILVNDQSTVRKLVIY